MHILPEHQRILIWKEESKLSVLPDQQTHAFHPRSLAEHIDRLDLLTMITVSSINLQIPS